jgi:hypothetical protein
MRILFVALATTAAALFSAAPGHADPGDQQLLSDMAAAGIGQDPVHQSPEGLISGARNTVCPDLDGGQSPSSIAATLEQYSKFTAAQADVYIRDAVRFYCPADAGKL